MRLSVIVPSLYGGLPKSLPDDRDVEVIVVAGVSPVGKARNEGLRRATGDYVAWVDADDEIEDGWLKAIKEAIVDNPDAVVFGCEETDPVDVAFSHAMWDVVASRKSLTEMSFDEIGQREDNLFLLRYLNSVIRWKAVKERHYIYIRNPESQTSRPRTVADSALFIHRAHEVSNLTEWQKARIDVECLKELCAWVANHAKEPCGWRIVRDSFNETIDRRNLKTHWTIALLFGYLGVKAMMRLCSLKGVLR